MPVWILSRSMAVSIPDRFGRSYLRTIFAADFLAVCTDHAAVAGSYPCKRLFDVLRLFIACMCILSTAIVKMILGTFTGFIMASGYYIISRLTVL